MPVYGLLGWQTGPHGAKEVWPFIWTVEAVAWSLRALVEAWALVYLFSTNTLDQKAIKILQWIEGFLIGLIAVTVTLLIVANKMNQSINELWSPLFWLWAVSVASFAPLMFAGVGIAYRVHIDNIPKNDSNELNDVFKLIEDIKKGIETADKRNNKIIADIHTTIDKILQSVENSNPVEKRRQQVETFYKEGLNQSQIANQLGVSVGTIYNDIKTLGLNGK
jgi:hypothetical protein